MGQVRQRNPTSRRRPTRDSQAEGKTWEDIVTFGSPKLVQSLAEAGLVDLFHIWLHPTLLGNGKPFFRGEGRLNLKLVENKAYKNGVVRLDYEPTPVAKG